MKNMADIFLTKEGFAKLNDELKVLMKVTLPDIKKRMADARADGDLSENNAWITAKEEMEIARMRMTELKQMLKEAKLVTAQTTKSADIRLGDTVVIMLGGTKMTVTIVPTMEVDAVNGKLSEESPIGKAIIGKKAGDKVIMTTPAGEQEIEILSKK